MTVFERGTLSELTRSWAELGRAVPDGHTVTPVELEADAVDDVAATSITTAPTPALGTPAAPRIW